MVGTFPLYDASQLICIKHTEHMAAMGNLHGRSVSIPVTSHNLNAIALKFHCNLLAKFSTA